MIDLGASQSDRRSIGLRLLVTVGARSAEVYSWSQITFILGRILFG